jgi:ATP-dependent Clp protease ATP-binding subunit ClpC
MLRGYNFSSQIRKVLAAAREEAVRFGHPYVGTEHLLLGLIREPEGGSATVLRDLDIAPENIRRKLEETLVPGPDMRTGPDLPYTSRAKKVLELGMDECERSHTAVFDTAQLLVALCAEGKGVAAQTLAWAGLTTDVARAAVDQIYGVTGEPPRPETRVPDVVAVTIEIKRADGSVTREVFHGVLAALEYLARQP